MNELNKHYQSLFINQLNFIKIAKVVSIKKEWFKKKFFKIVITKKGFFEKKNRCNSTRIVKKNRHDLKRVVLKNGPIKKEQSTKNHQNCYSKRAGF